MKTELLSPAGDIEAAYSAFYFGADAIYLGLRQFSARAEATNFSPDELDEITAYAHAHHKKVYVTVNTLIQEAELSSLLKTLSVCEKCHVDAVIVQDLGVAHIVKESFPSIALHASTQVAIHNLAGALTMKKLGFSRVVLARELSLPEIQEIQQKSGLEVEVFIHGALCYSYSGLCLFSSLTTGRSANRGKCVYSCRDTFKLNGKQYHPFSMKDLALEKDVLKLKGLSLKIEGRKKNPLYVGAVTDYYRRILDTGKVDSSLTDNLKQIFARPWTKLHLNGKKKDVIDPDFVGHRGLEIGKVEKIFNHTVTFKPTRSFARYDGIQIDVEGAEKPFGFSAENLIVNSKKVYEVPAHQTVTLGLPPHHPFIKKGDTIYLASSTRVKGAYDYKKPRPQEYKNRLPIEVDVYVTKDKITALSQSETAEILGPFEKAQNRTKMVEAINRAFKKTGDTVFELKKVSIHNEDNLFVPASVLNDLRRTLYSQIKPETKTHTLPKTSHLIGEKVSPKWIIKTDDLKIAQSIQDYDELIYVLSLKDTLEDIQTLPKAKLRLSLPTILRPEAPWHKQIEMLWNAGYSKWEIGNPSGFSLLPKEADISLDNTVSMFNSESIERALLLGAKRVTYSVEDTKENIKSLSSKTNKAVLVVYQDIPLFLSSNCIRENECKDCSKEPLIMQATNGKGHYLILSKNCQTTLMDERAFSIAHLVKDMDISLLRVDFCNKQYNIKNAQELFDKIKEYKKLPATMTGNFEKQFA